MVKIWRLKLGQRRDIYKKLYPVDYLTPKYFVILCAEVPWKAIPTPISKLYFQTNSITNSLFHFQTHLLGASAEFCALFVKAVRASISEFTAKRPYIFDQYDLELFMRHDCNKNYNKI